MNHYENLPAQGTIPEPHESSETAVPGAQPTRRELRDAERRASGAPVYAASVAPVPVAAPAPPAHPVQYASRRAAREAAASVQPVPVAPAAVALPTSAPVFDWAPAEPASSPQPTPAESIEAPATDVAPRRFGARRARTTRAAAQARPLRQRVTAAGTMVLTGGLVVTLSLSAYTGDSLGGYTAVAAESTIAQASIGAQALTIDESAVPAQIEARDTYEAVSPAQLRSMFREGLRQQNMEAYAQSGARELGDDYPWYAELTRGQGGGFSPLNYYYRECVDFVAWRLNRDAGSTSAPFVYNWSNLTPGAGSARSWKRQWEKHGWDISTTPAPGWVAWFPGGNHVAYVNSVLADGSVLIEEYNWGPHLYGQRIIPASDALYLAPPPR